MHAPHLNQATAAAKDAPADVYQGVLPHVQSVTAYLTEKSPSP